MTYSIVARCAETGQLGVAVQSHYFGVGRIVPWLAAGVGAVATQAQAELTYGDEGIARLRTGESPADALAALVEADQRSAHRQVGIVDAQGRVAAHTGDCCIAEASHVLGDGFTTHANMMLRTGVAERMAEVFANSTGALWERLLGALDAAEQLGGDIRGRQSAALVVVRAEPAGPARADHVIDVRVDDHPDPLTELRRIASLGVAYHDVSRAGMLRAAGDAEAIPLYESATATHPEHREFAFWHSLALAAHGRRAEARAAIAVAFAGDEGDRWRELLRRLPATGRIDDDIVDALLD